MPYLKNLLWSSSNIPYWAMYRFIIQYGEEDNTNEFLLYPGDTVGTLKKQIFEYFGVLKENQVLTGWPPGTTDFDDDTKLSSTAFPNSISLTLHNRLPVQNYSSNRLPVQNDSSHRLLVQNDSSHRLQVQNYSSNMATLKPDDRYLFTVECHNGDQRFRFLIPPGSTIMDVKKRMEKLSHIPVSEQIWEGMPSGYQNGQRVSEVFRSRRSIDLLFSSSPNNPFWNPQVASVSSNPEESINHTLSTFDNGYGIAMLTDVQSTVTIPADDTNGVPGDGYNNGPSSGVAFRVVSVEVPGNSVPSDESLAGVAGPSNRVVGEIIGNSSELTDEPSYSPKSLIEVNSSSSDTFDDQFSITLDERIRMFDLDQDCDLSSNGSARTESIEDADHSSEMSFEQFLQNQDQEELQKYKDKLLIASGSENEVEGSIAFSCGFRNQYGENNGPHFFTGTLQDAMNESCLKPISQRKPLAIYLHHAGGTEPDKFCKDFLCNESVNQFLSAYYLVWGWDLTLRKSRQFFFNQIKEKLGTSAMLTIQKIDVENLPAVVVLSRIRSSTEISTIIQSNVSLDNFISTLIQSEDIFSKRKQEEQAEMEVRSQREMEIMEQEEAYKESLKKDREKQKAREEQERIATEERMKQENMKRAEEVEKEVRRKMAESRLPPEPDEMSDNVLTLRFRLPDSNFIQRRFLKTDNLQALMDYLLIKDYAPEKFSLMTAFPRRDLSSNNPECTTLGDLKLYAQETLIVQLRPEFVVEELSDED